MKKNRLLFYIIISLIGFSSCISHKELLNFQEGESWESVAKSLPVQPVLIIQPDDILNVTVQSFDMVAAAPYNLMAISAASQGSAANINTPGGFLVDPSGNIDFPVLGQIKVGGLNLTEAKEKIQKMVAQQLVDPVVNIRFMNFRITVLGEVNSPATYTIPDQKINLLEALGLAGDLSTYGRRDNILIIREVNGKREFGRVNLKDRSFFNSPYFYLAQNDVIYVEPLKEKTNTLADKSSKLVPWLTVVITFVTLIVTVL